MRQTKSARVTSRESTVRPVDRSTGPGQHGRCRRNERGGDGPRGHAIRDRQGRAPVEAQPAKPQQRASEDHEGRVGRAMVLTRSAQHTLRLAACSWSQLSGFLPASLTDHRAGIDSLDETMSQFNNERRQKCFRDLAVACLNQKILGLTKHERR